MRTDSTFDEIEDTLESVRDYQIVSEDDEIVPYGAELYFGSGLDPEIRGYASASDLDIGDVSIKVDKDFLNKHYSFIFDSQDAEIFLTSFEEV